MAAIFVDGLGQKEQSLQRIFHRCFLPSVGTFRQAVSEEKIFKNQQYLYRDNCILNTDIYIQTRVIFLLTEIFRNQPIRNKNCLWRPCLLTNRDKMSNLYRGPSIDASYQVLVHLAKRFQRRRFLEIDQSETRIACGSHVC
jgi:hypothetical protein